MQGLSGSFDLTLNKENRKKLAIVRISEGFFEKLLKAITVEGLPEDAQLEAWCYDFDTASIKLKFWSKEFSLVAEGEVIPAIEEVVTTNWKIRLKKK